MHIEILTRCTKPTNLEKVKESIINSFSRKGVSAIFNWRIIFDTSIVSQIDTSILSSISEYTYYFWSGIPGDMGHQLLNRAIDMIDDKSWIYILDDDNLLHPLFAKEACNEETIGSFDAIIFSQFIGGKDFTGLNVREGKPENVKVKGIDMAQFLLKKSFIGSKRLEPMKYVADGIFISELYKEYPEKFKFLPNVILCYYNSLKENAKKSKALPRILMLGSSEEIKSAKIADYESDDLNVEIATNENVREKIVSFDPDCILTVGQNYEPFNNLGHLPYDFRQRWIHKQLPDGEAAYQCASNYILNPDYSDLVSIFTSAYNTKDKIFRSYQSILNQSYTNWEWVVINDSSDIETGKILRKIANDDPRVKVFEFNEKTNGIIGDAKYRACALSKGHYLLELDHDDFLLPQALRKMVDAFNAYPDAGFVYSDCAEIDENYNSLKYGEGFCFGYGKYRQETHIGKIFDVADTANINPITIRHIVGVPNHFRVWRRDVYFKIGGHNRRLSIADDYELIIRTFLETRFVKIPQCCYLQFFHGENSQNSTRADIQRRVRSIAQFYNVKIRDRFTELGCYDWAYKNDFSWGAPSRFGKEEEFVNYIMEIEK